MDSHASSPTGGGDAGESSALHHLLSPDGYYTYLGVSKLESAISGGPTVTTSLFASTQEGNGGELDADLVKKNYRKLSLRHHPDRRGGDAETFKALSRARKVLLTAKLRKEYDMLGLDLDDDEEESAHHSHGDSSDHAGSPPPSGSANAPANGASANTSSADSDSGHGSGSSSSADSVMSHIASATLATILQMLVRTVMMGSTSIFISQYKATVGLVACLIIFVLSKMKQNGGRKKEYATIGLIFVGVLLMYRGRCGSGSWTFWAGETLAMTMFLVNSFALVAPTAIMAVTVVACVSAAILKGKVWRYAIVCAFEAGLALCTVLIFPILEMLLEEIINDKLRKVGEKIRAHAKRVEAEERRRKGAAH